MNQSEIEKRFAQINARAPEHLIPEEAAHLAEAERSGSSKGDALYVAEGKPAI